MQDIFVVRNKFVLRLLLKANKSHQGGNYIPFLVYLLQLSCALPSFRTRTTHSTEETRNIQFIYLSQRDKIRDPVKQKFVLVAVTKLPQRKAHDVQN